MKKLQLGTWILAAALFVTPLCAAHGGRTDGRGGHRDNKNASGLGSYHYHCGGYPAHLHRNGVCPYSSPRTTASSSGGSVTRPVAAQAQPAHHPYMAATDMRTFIDGCEVPTFAHSDGGAYIIAEDLKDYGYDVYWDDDTKTLNIYRNAEKAVSPIPMESYRRAQRGAKCFDISSRPVSLRLWYGDTYYQPSLVYNLDGYIAVSVDELKCLGQFTWDGAARCIHIQR